MASITLAQAAEIAQSTLVQGIIEKIVTVNRFFDVLPFMGITGTSLDYDRELLEEQDFDALVRFAGVGDVIGGEAVSGGANPSNSKSPALFEKRSSSLTTIVGDAEVNGLIQATMSDDNDQEDTQVASKAKAAGRNYMNAMINGDGTNNTIVGLRNLVAAGQTFAMTPGAAGSGIRYGFSDLDRLMDEVKDMDGEVHYFAMNAVDIRSHFDSLRALGGASITETVQLPSGVSVPAYRQVPLLRCDYIPVNLGAGFDESVVFAGTFDDGSKHHGISGLTAKNDFGIQVQDVGASETKDENITRVKFYSSLANFSELGLVMGTGSVTPT